MNSQSTPPRLVMSDSDICVNYRQALDKRKQVGILADLNVCKSEQIIAVLVRNGYADPFAETTILPPANSTPPKPPEPPAKRKRNPNRDADIRTMFEGGASAPEIAKKLGMSPAWIYTCIKKMGIKAAVPTPADAPVTETEPIPEAAQPAQPTPDIPLAPKQEAAQALPDAPKLPPYARMITLSRV